MRTLSALVLSAVLVLVGGAVSAVVKNGDSGPDTLNGTNGRDTLRGYGGDDRLTGYRGDDRLVGGRGDDEVKGGLGRDNLDGGPGDDFVFAGFDYPRDRVSGGPGSDIVSIYLGDWASGGGGDDRLVVFNPNRQTVVRCGGGKDHVTAEGRPPAGVVASDCEQVEVR